MGSVLEFLGVSSTSFPDEPDLPGALSPHEVKDFFGQIDRDSAKLLLHGTRPPSGDMIASITDLFVAYQSRSAQGRVHFITTSSISHA